MLPGLPARTSLPGRRRSMRRRFAKCAPNVRSWSARRRYAPVDESSEKAGIPVFRYSGIQEEPSPPTEYPTLNTEDVNTQIPSTEHPIPEDLNTRIPEHPAARGRRRG